jgi:hypothetical protein
MLFWYYDWHPGMDLPHKLVWFASDDRTGAPRGAETFAGIAPNPERFRQSIVALQPGFSALRIKLDLIGDRGECPELSLLLWCLSVPEALTTGPISGEVRRRK